MNPNILRGGFRDGLVHYYCKGCHALWDVHVHDRPEEVIQHTDADCEAKRAGMVKPGLNVNSASRGSLSPEHPKPSKHPIWIQGVSLDAEAIRAHSEKYPVKDKRNGLFCGGAWIAFDPVSSMPFPEFLRLRVGKHGEQIGLPGAPENAEGHILIQNGWTFWQRLDLTKWAARSKFTPVDQEGVPVLWEATP